MVVRRDNTFDIGAALFVCDHSIGVFGRPLFGRGRGAERVRERAFAIDDLDDIDKSQDQCKKCFGLKHTVEWKMVWVIFIVESSLFIPLTKLPQASIRDRFQVRLSWRAQSAIRGLQTTSVTRGWALLVPAFAIGDWFHASDVLPSCGHSATPPKWSDVSLTPQREVEGHRARTLEDLGLSSSEVWNSGHEESHGKPSAPQNISGGLSQ
uniref:Uncharacterized protein n=1 Tax=Moniliophthora roreri TaxID=221103 RepID=A0A0W0G7M9_MONRR